MISKALTVALILSGTAALAHPVPDSTLSLTVADGAVTAALTVPMSEFGLVYDGTDPAGIAAYLAAHTGATSDAGDWSVAVTDVGFADGITDEGSYSELVATIILTPPDGSVTDFALTHDAIIGKVITDAVLVSYADTPDDLIGVLSVDPVDGSITPLLVPVSTSR